MEKGEANSSSAEDQCKCLTPTLSAVASRCACLMLQMQRSTLGFKACTSHYMTWFIHQQGIKTREATSSQGDNSQHGLAPPACD